MTDIYKGFFVVGLLLIALSIDISSRRVGQDGIVDFETVEGVKGSTYVEDLSRAEEEVREQIQSIYDDYESMEGVDFKRPETTTFKKFEIQE